MGAPATDMNLILAGTARDRPHVYTRASSEAAAASIFELST